METFSLKAEDVDMTVDQLEAALLAQLPQAEALLRWAVVKAEQSTYWCEGAYTTQKPNTP